MNDIPNTAFDLQPVDLRNELVTVRPLKLTDFDTLFNIASDPLIWEQHPEKERYKKDVFESFFAAAIESQSAFVIVDTKTNEPIGSSRYYDYDVNIKTVAIGFTFIARKYWGTDYNRSLKELMLDYAFRYVEDVLFHVGTGNIRSQKAVEKLGAKKHTELQIKFTNGRKAENFIYQIDRESWQEQKQRL